ncbi:hypothetical protein [Candidatus Amarobacter glycogenicus]|uniref:hypothetical protein n=1 Tax=Candidatus Amarobacter glycogenicus TaxID=3140699 RepID=UPI002A116F8B|nr:hypothetical protein [Dehalococcoidia bacterium]
MKTANGEMVEGWAQSRYIQVFGEGETAVSIAATPGELTSKYLSRMVNDRFFWPAVRTTLLLIVIIIPYSICPGHYHGPGHQANLKLSSLFLYIFAIPLAASDLAIGIVCFPFSPPTAISTPSCKAWESSTRRSPIYRPKPVIGSSSPLSG